MVEATIEAVEKARQMELESRRFGKVTMALREGAASQQYVAEGWRRGKQAERHRRELEDDCRRAPGAERRVRLEGGRVVLQGRHQQAHEVMVDETKGKRRRDSPEICADCLIRPELVLVL